MALVRSNLRTGGSGAGDTRPAGRWSVDSAIEEKGSLMPARQARAATVHLASGERVAVLLDKLDVEDDEDILTDLVEDLTHRPSWQVIGDSIFFTGAVSAITLD
jgi:hypothetical protein